MDFGRICEHIGRLRDLRDPPFALDLVGKRGQNVSVFGYCKKNEKENDNSKFSLYNTSGNLIAELIDESQNGKILNSLDLKDNDKLEVRGVVMGDKKLRCEEVLRKASWFDLKEFE